MFVEELDIAAGVQAEPIGGFLVRTASDLNRITSSNAMSVVIESGKGITTKITHSQCRSFSKAGFHRHLRETFTCEQIALAQQTIGETRSYVRNVLAQAQLHHVFEFDAACVAVEKIMAQAMSNSGALIGICKLKDKDEGTFFHSMAVSALMITFGRKLGMSEEKVQLLGLGGLVHDLGKMVLPIELLRKPGKLTPDELTLIRTHPQHGHDLLLKQPHVSQAVLDICLYHHEKLDGSGYPSRLAGTDIPLMARIAAICDVYDALTTVRPYKRAWTKAEAIDTMIHSRGHFDPKLLDAFISEMAVNGTLH